MKNILKNIKSTTGKYTLFIPVTKKSEEYKSISKKHRQNDKINVTSLKEEKIHTLVSKLLTENHNKSIKTVHHKLKDPSFLHIQSS